MSNDTMPDEKAGRSQRILIVDDEPAVLRVLREVLERPDLYLVEAEDGERAIELLLSEPFDLLIADKNLPGVTGLDVIRQAKSIDSKIGALIVTGFASRRSAEEALVIGIDDYLIKPFDLDDLIRTVDDALQRRLQRGRLNEEPVCAPESCRVLVCEPDEESRRIVLGGLKILGHNANAVDSVHEIMQALRNEELDALVCSLELLNRDDASACFLRSSLILSPQVMFVAVASSRHMDDAIEAIHRGAGLLLSRPLKSGERVAEQLKGFLSSSIE